MKITKQYIKKLIKEEMEDLGMPNPAPHPVTDKPGGRHERISMELIDRLREMKAEVTEMAHQVDPDVDEAVSLQLHELAREIEVTILAFEAL